MKLGPYLVLYEEYTAHNQFEGQWSRNWRSYNTLQQAQAQAAGFTTSEDFRNITVVIVVV